MVVRNKNEKKFIFFILYCTKTYGENTIYIFVDFRIKRACRANYRGATFLLMRKAAILETRISKSEAISKFIFQRLKKKNGEFRMENGESGGFPVGLFEKTKPICRPSAGNPKH